jgi:hypothetical protein
VKEFVGANDRQRLPIRSFISGPNADKKQETGETQIVIRVKV